MNFAQNKVADTKMGNDVLISFDAQSKEEVDEMAKNVAKEGGKSLVNQMKHRYGCMLSVLKI